MRLNLTSGLVPSLGVPAGLLGFFMARAWIRVQDVFGVPHLPFTRQENALIQTAVVSCSSIAFTGGFGTYILGMSAKSATERHIGNEGKNMDEPNIGRLIAFLFLVNFAGLFIIIPLRKMMIIRHRLTFPSGTATAHLINSFHTPHGAKQARQQVGTLLKSLGATVLWPLFQWLFTGGKNCGLEAFPTFGMLAYQRGFYFDLSTTNVGIGMICPPMITASMLAGSVVSWGILWPYIETKAGRWFPENLDANDLGGIMGYRVFVGVSMILADGLFTFLSSLVRTANAMRKRRRGCGGHARASTTTSAAAPPFQCLSATERTMQTFDDRRRAQVFLRDRLPAWVAVAAYVALAAISTAAVPRLYPQLGYRHVAAAYVAAPVFAFCNAYSVGVTDMNLSATYGKIAMLVYCSWVGIDGGGVVAGLAACGIIVSAVSGASDFMQDFKTGYLTLTSPRAVLVGQVAGTALGCVVNPAIFWVFYKVYNMAGGGAAADDDDVAPYARAYRGIAMLSVGRHGLPEHSLLLCKLFFALALVLSAAREAAERRRWRAVRYIPSTVGVAVAFFVPPRIPVGMAAGCLALHVWRTRVDAGGAGLLSPVVASGLICGDGLGSLMSSMLTLLGARPPICVKFLSRFQNQKLDAFLTTLRAS
ncbi:probable metal-nicotianamine transporter YSL17 [Oryza brachyantha]|uniref:probable metal-nicotianamine transporter YSL17 n=1 Tax=Oryza brachyantha TaxID=4533 RepID=UPI001AD97404|nr:probable metal-nicotianamine transporter YSL17 [Oryza brachyantha]